MAPDVTHILTYIKVIEQGSFTKAAQVLNLSKSVVSKHVCALEAVLECQLLQRSTRKLVVTEIGLRYYQSVKNIPSQLDHAQEMIFGYQDVPKGVLKVIAPANFESSLKADVIPTFLTQNPQVTLDLQFEKKPQEYINGDFDIVIMWKLSQNNFPDYNLLTKKLFTMPVGIYAAPKYLHRHGTPKVPEDLLAHNCFSTIDFKWPFKMKNGAIQHIDVQGNLQTRSAEIIHEAAVQGLGVAYSYPFVFEQALRNNSVVKLLDEYTQFFVDIHVFYHQSAYKPLKVCAFIECVQDCYQKMQNEILRRGEVLGASPDL